MNARCFGLLLFVSLAVAACSQTPESEPATSAEAKPDAEKDEEGDLVAVISTDKGDMVVRLLADLAPKSAAQFQKLSESGFYTRTTFHFVSSGFILGGDPFSKDNDPYNDGLGNAAEWIEAEFDAKHQADRGCVGLMRKESDPNTASCQFFIVLKRKPEWDGKYNIFGDVVEGIEVAESISKVTRVKTDPKLADRPAAKQIIKGIRIERRKLPPATV